ncbi:flavin reductase family protein [Glaciimonas sp. PAMC28666]|uniref:flavin reductase family protein n=1 Tax=Glaciimonas sp. PAMC28666 TaxID=2807626 RepID=UPI001966C877|nr:flavin reductase family protein [Glaciimonas sp. PAMC28666]QRX81744.1 flavin reductase [Glaciimonas sp. PAMC28666]
MQKLSDVSTKTPNVLVDFRNAMRRLSTTVSLVTSTDNGVWHGMTATAVTSVSTSPCALLVCVNESSSFHKIIKHTGTFCVNLLGVGQSNLSGIFSGERKGLSRFDVGTWTTDENGLPYLMDAQANIFCDVDKTMHYETHTIFVGRVRDARCFGVVAPLLFQEGHYASSIPLS